ncbi:MAG: site-specific integrase [Thermoplasmata archaeon]|nr:MAG: site-specific integrase [Thermoplasmata archaeon]
MAEKETFKRCEDDSPSVTAMPRNEFRRVQNLLIRKKRKSGRTERHIQELRRITSKFYDYLKDTSQETNPRKIGEEAIRGYLEIVPARSRNHQLSAINSLLKTVGNNIVETEEIEAPRLARINVDWLDLSQTEAIRKVAKDEETALFHLALDLCLRRSEIRRLKAGDIQDGYLRILGKGKNGGKPRTISFHKDTRRTLRDQLERRENIIRQATQKRKVVEVPGEVFLTACPRWGLTAIKNTALDDRLKRLSDRAGIHFSWHTLRRTGARFLWEAKVPVETIARILGHSSTRVTLTYIGVDLDHMTNAFEQLDQWKREQSLGGTYTPPTYIEP